MSDTQASAETSPASAGGAPWWAFALLGAALLALGFIILGNLPAATLATAIVFGALVFAGGVFQIIQAFWAKAWKGFLLSLIVGVLYAVAGVILMLHPVVTSMVLTALFAALFIISGVFRIVLATRFWQEWGWLLLVSGIIGILAGVVIFSGWPASGLWVLGLLVAVDVIIHGVWWIAFGVSMRTAASHA